MKFEEIVEEIDKHLGCTRQNWLFGAGISYESNIPLMFPLTRRVEKLVKENNTDYEEMYDLFKQDLPVSYHIEHLLSHLVDYMAICKRSVKNKINLGAKVYGEDILKEFYEEIISAIAITVRYGYVEERDMTPEKIGKLGEPIVILDHHDRFIKALFSNRANMINRSEVNIFTTNYDTLLEDALAINKKSYVDGFSNGGIGCWDIENGFDRKSRSNAVLICKLHGSIDWYVSKESGLLRTRYGTKYLSGMSSTLIYPQATKYVETQKDPFASLFTLFRNTLQRKQDNILVACGYSFGDDHVNNEIEIALSDAWNKSVLIAFIKEDQEGNTASCLDRWLKEEYGSRVFVLTDTGVYNSHTKYTPEGERELDWWTFIGMTKFLEEGEI
jgi:hypothetical protein